MYKPPENMNRVKAMLSKFENNENNQEEMGLKSPRIKRREDKVLGPLSATPEHRRPSHQVLSRQLSDPVKRNIKRTPAFRLDKSQNPKLQESSLNSNTNRNKYIDNKIKLFDGRLKENSCDKEDINKDKVLNGSPESGTVSVLRKQFSNTVRQRTDSLNDTSTDDENVSSEIKLLYAKPIPKALRTKLESCSNSESESPTPNTQLRENQTKVLAQNGLHNHNNRQARNWSEELDLDMLNKEVENDLNISSHKENILKLTNLNIDDSDVVRRRPNIIQLKSDFNTASQLSPQNRKEISIETKLTTLERKLQSNNNNLSDTLKKALKKPLPAGPAPRKPPRTFQHSPKTDLSPDDSSNSGLEKNISQLHIDRDFKKKLNNNLLKNQVETTSSSPKSGGKGDAKYMLDKLENALKNNKIRLKRSTNQSKIDTSEEECEEEKDVSNNRKKLPPPNSNLYTQTQSSQGNNSSSKFNLNCLSSGFDCTKTNSVYEHVAQSNSCFFVDKPVEPVYATPFQFKDNKENESSEQNNKRNSLYYMSNPVLNINSTTPTTDENPKKSPTNKAFSEKEMSSATNSDSETASSCELHKIVPKGNIRDIIKAFENSSQQQNQQQLNKKNKEDNLSTSLRLQVLENQLRDTLESSSLSTSLPETKKSQETLALRNKKKDEIVDRFETYVRTVRIFSNTDKVSDEKNLFTSCFLVGLMGKTPYIKFKFPKNVEIPQKIEELCFPDVVDGPMDDSKKSQSYSLVITKESGERTYGYCRRVLPEGSTHCMPLVYCILSKHRAPRFYRKILKHIETRHGFPDKVRDLLLHEFYNKSFPSPGHIVKFDLSQVKACINYNDEINQAKQKTCDNSTSTLNNKQDRSSNDSNELDLNSFVIVGFSGQYGTLNKRNNSLDNAITTLSPPEVKQLKKSSSSPIIHDEDIENTTEIKLKLHQDMRYEETDLEKLCSAMNASTLKKVFASLLLERKVIFISCVLSLLSSCIEALQSILYPFSWPHTLIPVLPQSLYEIVEAPTPLICGCLSISVVNDYTIENAIVIDLDIGHILQEVGDEEKILPSALVKTWEKGMSIAYHIPKQESAKNVFLGDAFLRVFVDSCGRYKNFIVNKEFKKEDFIAYATTKGVKRFLKWFTETTMFYMFINTIINDEDSFPIFDKRIQIYSSPESDAILEKMKDWKT